MPINAERVYFDPSTDCWYVRVVVHGLEERVRITREQLEDARDARRAYEAGRNAVRTPPRSESGNELVQRWMRDDAQERRPTHRTADPPGVIRWHDDAGAVHYASPGGFVTLRGAGGAGGRGGTSAGNGITHYAETPAAAPFTLPESGMEREDL